MDKFIKFTFTVPLWISLTYASSFNYHDFNSWTAISPLCDNGKLQSPIDLGPMSKTNNGLQLDFKNYAATLSNAAVLNSGHSVRVTGNWGKNVPTITGTLINNTQYLLGDVHLHWGEKDNSGTDHSINGKRYACELHFVHYNAKYGNLLAALKKPDGLLVIALLYKVSKEAPNLGLQALSNLTAAVSEVNSKSTGILDLGLFGIEKIKSFYSYAGSFTSPPCTENVFWLVAKDVFPTNAATMKVIRSTQLSVNDKSNVRPVQPLNGRQVILYKN